MMNATKTSYASLTAVVGLLLFFAMGCASSPNPTASTENPAANTGSFDTPPANQTRPAPANDNDAIAAAIRAHLAGNSSINMAAMEMTVTQVNITGNQAQADAEFHLKQGGTSMQMIYFLQRHANGWIVSRSQPSGGQFAHPPMDKTHSGLGGAPAHPKIEDFFQTAPPSGGNSSVPAQPPPDSASKKPY